MGFMDLVLFVSALYVAIHHMKEVQIFREVRNRERRGSGAPVAINGGEGENLNTPKRRSISIMEVIIQDTIPYYIGCVLLLHFGSFRTNKINPHHRLLILQIINSTAWLGLRHHTVLTSLSSDLVHLI